MSMIVKGREIVLNDHDVISATINGEYNKIDVFWYLEKVDENVYPFDENHPVDYILFVYSHIKEYQTNSSYPMDRMYFYMIHNPKYRYYLDPENIKTIITLKNIYTNDIIYQTTANNSTRYPGNHTFNDISKLNIPIYEKFNGIPEEKYQEIKDILGIERCNSVCIDTALIQSTIGDNTPLSNTCYLYDDINQITCKLVYTASTDIPDPTETYTEIEGTINVSDVALPFDFSGLFDVSVKTPDNDINGVTHVALETTPVDIDGTTTIHRKMMYTIAGTFDINLVSDEITGTANIFGSVSNNIDGTVDVEVEVDLDGEFEIDLNEKSNN